MEKIKEAQNILRSLGLPSQQQNKIAALSLLALCNLKPQDSWGEAQRVLCITNEVMNFVNLYYNEDYQSGTRESFRKQALKPFVVFGLAELNPDNPDRPITSQNTHYAISLLALTTIKKFNTNEWETALDNFLRYKNSSRLNEQPVPLLRTVYINSYKSIVDDRIDLGRFNVFIGVNGCGKTNILEALATVGADAAKDLTFDGLYSRGVRLARPDLTLSSFLETDQKSSIEINLKFEESVGTEAECRFSLTPANLNDVYTRWFNLSDEENYPQTLVQLIKQITQVYPAITGAALIDEMNKTIAQKGFAKDKKFSEILSAYAIFDLNTRSLRGVAAADSKKTPLGLNGEGLDLTIASFNKSERENLNKALQFFDWLAEIVSDKEDKFKLLGLKPGRSISTLYFRDKYMLKGNNTFSAENSNEGVLHVLFYLALFVSKKTPNLFAIDNIETALNPRLCQILISELVKLSVQNQKQVLITTHNPAILDGLNLLDDEQRLFEVYRTSEGKTKTRRIKFKADLSNKQYKLSEMWLKGSIGAVPKNF
jgi:predicted ATPase